MYTHPLTGILLQAPYGMTDSQVHWLIAFTALTAVAVLIQAIALGAISIVVVKLVGQITTLTAELKPKIYPILDNARDLVGDTVPKIKRVTTNITDTTDVYRAKLAEFDALVTDTTQKAKRQSDRVDGMVSDGLTSAGQVVGHIQNAVMAPVRQASHIIDLVRSNIERLTQRGSAAAAAASAAASDLQRNSGKRSTRTPRAVAFEGDNVYTGLEDDYHA